MMQKQLKELQEQIGKDLSKLQELISVLEKLNTEQQNNDDEIQQDNNTENEK